MGENDARAGMAAHQPGMRRNVSMSEMSDLDSTDDGVYHVRKSRLIRLINWWQVGQTSDMSCMAVSGGGIMSGET